MILVSACLAGYKTRYDGRTSFSPELAKILKGQKWMAICPEQLGGLGTPRAPCRLVGGNGLDVWTGRASVIDIDGQDRTAAFIKGARSVLNLCHRLQIKAVYLKDRSPSCGVWATSGPNGLVEGPGMTAALLLQENCCETIEIKAKST